MEKEREIINRVTNSQLVSLDLEEHIPDLQKDKIDLADFLFQNMILREKDFRQKVKEYDFSRHKGNAVLVYCSEDAIIPAWAYMLLVSRLQESAAVIAFGTDEDLDKEIVKQSIQNIDLEVYQDKKVVIKGCGDLPIRDFAYFEISKKVLPHVASLMYGEPCSTVPVYKRKKITK